MRGMENKKMPVAKLNPKIPQGPEAPDLSLLLRIPGDVPVNLYGFSALDRYFGIPALPFFWIETSADISVLARAFEGLRFPGPALADGAVDAEEGTYYFHCSDPGDPWRPSFKLFSFRQDIKTGRFRDPEGLYPLLRELRDGSPGKGRLSPGGGEGGLSWRIGLYPETSRMRALMDGALILARYGPAAEEPSRLIPETAALFDRLPGGPPPGQEEQRLLLTAILVSPRPDLGLELLKAGGFLRDFWPELADMDEVDHSKEFHPEGNVWKHTLETFRYRKPACGLRLSLGLLLHDIGKVRAESSKNHRFEGHAELGARQARRFLERLGFEAPLVEDIFYLVKNHMLPAALPRLPLARTGEIMASPLFPTLMELYRCDESSSFKGLEAYYESSAAYQAYLRHRRNPYRSADGKKLRNGTML
jgi:poly(A) polymerase